MKALTRDHIRTEGLPQNLLAKWPADLLEEGYTPLPKKLLRVLGELFPGEAGMDAFRVVMAIIDYYRPHLSHPPSIDYLAFTAGLGTDRVREVLVELEERGFAEQIGEDERYLILRLSGLAEAIRRACEEGEDPAAFETPDERERTADLSPWS